MRYRCTKTHYHPDDRALPRGERRVIKKGDVQEFAVAPRSGAWERDDEAVQPAPEPEPEPTPARKPAAKRTAKK